MFAHHDAQQITWIIYSWDKRIDACLQQECSLSLPGSVIVAPLLCQLREYKDGKRENEERLHKSSNLFIFQCSQCLYMLID